MDTKDSVDEEFFKCFRRDLQKMNQLTLSLSTGYASVLPDLKPILASVI